MRADRAELRLRAQRRADQENQNFVPEAEWNVFLNEGIVDLYDLLVKSYRDYYRLTFDITVVSGTKEYALPAEFYKGTGVYWVDGDYEYELDPFMMGEQGDSISAVGVGTGTGRTLMYRFIGSQIIFAPSPSEGGTSRLYYVPRCPLEMQKDTDHIDFPLADGGEEYVITSAAMKALLKEEMFEHVAGLKSRFNDLRHEITTAAAQRDAARPQRVRDVRRWRRYPRRRRVY